MNFSWETSLASPGPGRNQQASAPFLPSLGQYALPSLLGSGEEPTLLSNHYLAAGGDLLADPQSRLPPHQTKGK
jgi:hypothetical protein